PARVCAPRAAVAHAEHGAGRLLVGGGQHAGTPQPLVGALVPRPALPLRGGNRGPRAVSLDDGACPPLGPARDHPPPAGDRRPRAPPPRSPLDTPTPVARASSRSGSPPPAF